MFLGVIMAKKRRKNNLASDAMGLAGGAITVSLGGSILTGVGASAVPMANISRYLPAAGTVMGGGYALKYLRRLK